MSLPRPLKKIPSSVQDLYLGSENFLLLTHYPYRQGHASPKWDHFPWSNGSKMGSWHSSKAVCNIALRVYLVGGMPLRSSSSVIRAWEGGSSSLSLSLSQPSALLNVPLRSTYKVCVYPSIRAPLPTAPSWFTFLCGFTDWRAIVGAFIAKKRSSTSHKLVAPMPKTCTFFPSHTLEQQNESKGPSSLKVLLTNKRLLVPIQATKSGLTGSKTVLL